MLIIAHTECKVICKICILSLDILKRFLNSFISLDEFNY
jgi:hypothetical protein